MRYIILLATTILALNLSAQNPKHNIFGLDMDLDWYSLTNHSTFTYIAADHESKDFITMDFDYHLNQVDIELEEFNFSEYLIIFEKGKKYKTELATLSPFMFLGRYRYPNK